MECVLIKLRFASDNSRRFLTPQLVSRKMTSEGRMQKFHTDDLGSTSDLWKQISLATRLIRSTLSTTQSEQ